MDYMGLRWYKCDFHLHSMTSQCYKERESDTIDMWVYAVPLGFLAAFVLKLPVEVVYFLLCTDEFVKWPWVFKRFYSYKWARNITRDDIDKVEAVASE